MNQKNRAFSLGPLFDHAAGLAKGEALKERGIETTKEHHEKIEWFQDAMDLFQRFLALTPRPFSSPDFRRYADNAGLVEPAHPNAWGAIINTASKQNLIRWTGRMVKCDIPASHASVIMEWERMP